MAPPPPPLCRPQWLIRSHAPIEHAQSYGARLEVGPSPCVRSHRTTRTPRYTACLTLTRNNDHCYNTSAIKHETHSTDTSLSPACGHLAQHTLAIESPLVSHKGVRSSHRACVFALTSVRRTGHVNICGDVRSQPLASSAPGDRDTHVVAAAHLHACMRASRRAWKEPTTSARSLCGEKVAVQATRRENVPILSAPGLAPRVDGARPGQRRAQKFIDGRSARSEPRPVEGEVECGEEDRPEPEVCGGSGGLLRRQQRAVSDQEGHLFTADTVKRRYRYTLVGERERHGERVHRQLVEPAHTSSTMVVRRFNNVEQSGL